MMRFIRMAMRMNVVKEIHQISNNQHQCSKIYFHLGYDVRDLVLFIRFLLKNFSRQLSLTFSYHTISLVIVGKIREQM